jgi:hypothetical protein
VSSDTPQTADPLEQTEEPAGGAGSSASLAHDRSTIYEYLCQLSEFRDCKLIAEDHFQVKRAELLRQI